MLSTADRPPLRSQRNRYAVAAVLILLISMGISLPRALHRRRDLKATNDEVIRLQGELTSIQQQARELQSQIVATQTEILALQKNAK